MNILEKQKKIRVLECIRQGQIGGGESHLLSLVENLDKNIFTPIVLSFTDGPMINRLTEMGIATHIIPSTKAFDYKVWSKVKKLMLHEKIDLVHAHGTRANSNVIKASKALKLPLVYTVHGWSFHVDQSFIVRKLRTAGEKFLTARSSKNISVSVSNQKTGIDTIKGFKSVVINNGIDQKKFDPSKTFANIRKELNIPANAILVLFVARFTNHKQPLTLINAFAEALKSNTNLFLLMVGDGDQKEEAIELTKKYAITDRIIFQHFRQDVPDVLAAADIFVLPSLWEGLPIGLLEAMSMGKAIIASNVDGTKDIIVHNSNGELIELKNLAKELPEAIVKLAADDSLRMALGKQAIKTVQHNFNAAQMTLQIEQVYTQLLNKA